MGTFGPPLNQENDISIERYRRERSKNGIYIEIERY